jgi:transposase
LIARHERVSAALEETHATAAKAKGTRRSWSRAEKRRIVEEAFRPGASVADVARSHGLNSNQVFNWRRRALAATAAKTNGQPSTATKGERSATQSTAFLPIGMIVQTNDDGTTGMSPPATPSIDAAAANCPTMSSPAMEQRPGMIEIDLACGTRLRVDACVNERALRRVLSVLKVSS